MPADATAQELTAPGRTGLKCQNCGAELTIASDQRATVCAFCGAGSVVARPVAPDRPDPVFVLGFIQDERHVRDEVRRWLKRRNIFCPSGVRAAEVEKIQAVYVPAYLYSASARTRFQAEIGEDYQVTETEETTDSEGKSQTRTVTRTETEWQTLRGEHAAHVTDVVVTASRGISNAELTAVEPFDLRALTRYTPATVAGWVAEDASMTREECLMLARDEAGQKATKEVGDFLPGDHQRQLQTQTELERESLDLMLIPLWLLNARYARGKPPMRVVVNGQTGKTWAKVPLSPYRITFAVLAAILTAAALYTFFTGHLPWAP